MATQYVEYENVFPLLAPIDITSTTTESGFMDLSKAHDAAFLVSFGVLSSASTTDDGVITVEAASVNASGSEAAIGFSYRLSATVGTGTWGAITAVAATSTGAPMALGSDGMLMHIQIDPSAVNASSTTVQKRWVRVSINPTAEADHTVVEVIGITRSRYKQTNMISAVS
jgi:hypothetical protein